MWQWSVFRSHYNTALFIEQRCRDMDNTYFVNTPAEFVESGVLRCTIMSVMPKHKLKPSKREKKSKIKTGWFL